MRDRLILEREFQQTPNSRKLGYVSIFEKNTNNLKTNIQSGKNKKGVMKIVCESIKSTFVDTFNRKTLKSDYPLETFIAQRLSCGKDANSDFDYRKSFNIVSNKKYGKGLNLHNEQPLKYSKDKFYSMKSILGQINSKNIEANLERKEDVPQQNKLNDNCLDHYTLRKAILSSKKISPQKQSQLLNYKKSNYSLYKFDTKKSISKKDSNSNSFNFSKFLNSPNSRTHLVNAASQIDAENNDASNVPKLYNQESLNKRNSNNLNENNDLSSSHTDLQKVSYLINNDLSPSENKLVKNKSFIQNQITPSDLEIMEYKLFNNKEIKTNQAKRLRESLTSATKECTRTNQFLLDNEKLKLFLKKKSTSRIKSYVEVVKNSPLHKEQTKPNNHKFLCKLIENGSTDKNLIKIFNKMNKEECKEKKGKKHSKNKKIIQQEKNDRFHMLKLELFQYKENKRIILHSLSKVQKDCDEYLTNYRKLVNMEKHKLHNNKKHRKISG